MQNVTVKLRGIHQELSGKADIDQDVIEIDGLDHQTDHLPFDVPEINTVYGLFLNYQGAYEALEPQMNEAPYKNPPKAPVLYIKPKNTHISDGQAIPLPQNTETLLAGAALAVVIGKTATKVSAENALDYVAGYTIANDVTIPHDNFHRPAVKKNARDGFCPVGPWVVAEESIADPNQLNVKVSVNGKVKQENNTNNLIRTVEKALQDVTEFMTLNKGDVLLVGVPENAPEVKANDLVTVEIEGIGALSNRVTPEKDVLGGGIL